MRLCPRSSSTITEMQQSDTAQVTPRGGDPAAADLLCAIPGMAVTLVRQHHELMELNTLGYNPASSPCHRTCNAMSSLSRSNRCTSNSRRVL